MEFHCTEQTQDGLLGTEWKSPEPGTLALSLHLWSWPGFPRKQSQRPKLMWGLFAEMWIPRAARPKEEGGGDVQRMTLRPGRPHLPEETQLVAPEKPGGSMVSEESGSQAQPASLHLPGPSCCSFPGTVHPRRGELCLPLGRDAWSNWGL